MSKRKQSNGNVKTKRSNNRKRGQDAKNARSNGQHFAEKLAEEKNYQDAAEVAAEAKAKFSSTPVSPRNDVTWYFKDANLLNDVASFSYSTPLGSPVPITVLNPTAIQDAAYSSIPGLMSIEVWPAPGISRDATSPLNIGAQNVYSFVRYKNSGAKNYDAPDLMLYYLALDSVYSAWNWAKRLYGMASSYSQVNKYMPRAWFAANRVSYDSVVGNLADFRAGLNILADQISAFCVPGVFNYMVRHSWMFANIYQDSETTKAQQYMFVPAAFYQYDETSSLHGGILKPINVTAIKPTADYTYQQVLDLIKGMVDALQYSEDIGIMSGDTLKAYGEGTMFRLSHIDADYSVLPAYRREVLSQIENCRFAPWADYVNADAMQRMTIKQDPDTNFIKFNPQIKTGSTNYGNSAGGYLNYHWNNPTPEDVMESTRLNVSWDLWIDAPNRDCRVQLVDSGTEIPLRVNIFWFAQKSTTGTEQTGYLYKLQEIAMDSITATPVDSFTKFNVTDVAQQILKLWLWCAFDWAPELYNHGFTGRDAAHTKWLSCLNFRDWDVFTPVTRENMFAMNQLALLSMFDVPN